MISCSVGPLSAVHILVFRACYRRLKSKTKTGIFFEVAASWISLTPINLMLFQIINNRPYGIFTGTPVILTEKTIIAG